MSSSPPRWLLEELYLLTVTSKGDPDHPWRTRKFIEMDLYAFHAGVPIPAWNDPAEVPDPGSRKYLLEVYGPCRWSPNYTQADYCYVGQAETGEYMWHTPSEIEVERQPCQGLVIGHHWRRWKVKDFYEYYEVAKDQYDCARMREFIRTQQACWDYDNERRAKYLARQRKAVV